MHSHCRCDSVCSSETNSVSSQSTNKMFASPSIQWRQLEQLSFHIQPSGSKNDRKSVHYDLQVTHRTSNTTWTRRLLINEYHTFVYKTLLPTMQQGHFCDAECPWIYSFVVGTFPKNISLFRSTGSCVVMCRQEALEKCITQVHQYLVNKNNYKCRVTQAVATEFLSFVLGENAPQAMMELEQLVFSSSSTVKSSGSSSESILSTSSRDPLDEELNCLICNQSLVQAGGCSYTTVLRCGHEFHEECLVAKLNETIGCPVCGHMDI